jgi:hypothetical protein
MYWKNLYLKPNSFVSSSNKKEFSDLPPKFLNQKFPFLLTVLPYEVIFSQERNIPCSRLL